MSDARTQILGRAREALGADELDVPVPREYRVTGDLAPGSDDVVDLLVDRLVDYRATVHHATTPTVAETVAALIADARTVVVPTGLDVAWRADWVPEVLEDSREEPLDVATLDAAGAVVTAARVACADTGTILLDGEPDQGRRAITLVPDVHVCVLRADQVVHLLPEAIRMLAPHPARPITWISGPSATSDIELSRVEGVHGPRTLHVVIVR
ncbi:LutC/YkgG family protein [Paraoerskovia marina]|uniref:LutC/YkgG family protein n=1 Tax=Paraoerskovia marina TaxID=545619 RepID=UPI00049260F5|nr:LUD domain-containing protein [Paraoerskovia marina]